MNCQDFSPKFRNSREFPPGIFEVADSREFPVALGTSSMTCICRTTPPETGSKLKVVFAVAS